MNPGLDGVCTHCSIWSHFLLQLSAPFFDSLSPAHFLCWRLSAESRSVTVSSSSLCSSVFLQSLQCSRLIFVFCIFYQVKKYQFCTSNATFFFFFNNNFCFLSCHSGLIKHLHFSVQIFSGNDFFLFENVCVDCFLLSAFHVFLGPFLYI